MHQKTTQCNFRIGPRLKELIFALSETSGQTVGKVMEQAIFHEAMARALADLRSGALKLSEAKIDIALVRHDFGAVFEHLTNNLLTAYSRRLGSLSEPTNLLLDGCGHGSDGLAAKPQASSTPSEHPRLAETEHGSGFASEVAVRENVYQEPKP